MGLYIGTNYHPHDWGAERWETDIRLMKEAGFTTVRLGHLCWDSYEPEEGRYTFEWFDQIMDLMHQAGLQVLLDVSVRPAPVWVHKLCPGCDVYGKAGTKQWSIRRYMEDVDDPAYQYYALRFARVLVKRYCNHPALFAFGICNELGDGYLSYSESARRRFAQWLRHTYGSIEALNEAWAARRWSRKLTAFDDVVFPENELTIGAPEAWLDMRRFFAEGIEKFILKLKDTIEQAGGQLHSSNHYGEKANLGFDYLKIADELHTVPGMGLYPGYDISEKYFYLMSIYHQRLAELGKPMWCLEFQTGSKNIPWGPAGALRMQALLSLIYRNQMVLGWTWRSMLGGEEHFLHGMLAHDGEITPNYREYQRIAEDFKKLEQYDFPYLPLPDIAVAYSSDAYWCSQYNREEFKQPYWDAMTMLQRIFFQENLDYNVVDLRNLKHAYSMLIIPGQQLMSREMAETVRLYVKNGGTVLMTAASAVVDETGKVFDVARPGYLDDVFGIRVSGYYRSSMNWTFGENTKRYIRNGEEREVLTLEKDGESLEIYPEYYEILQTRGASVYASLQGKNLAGVTVNTYGKGRAYYMACEPEEEILRWMFKQVGSALHIRSMQKLPEGVQARWIGKNQFFVVNTNRFPVKVPFSYVASGVLRDRKVEGDFLLEAYDGELFILEENGGKG